jgi:hypothetical protein
MRPDFGFERIGKRLIFVLAVVGALLWKKAALHHISEQLGVGPIGQAQTGAPSALIGFIVSHRRCWQARTIAAGDEIHYRPLGGAARLARAAMRKATLEMRRRPAMTTVNFPRFFLSAGRPRSCGGRGIGLP